MSGQGGYGGYGQTNPYAPPDNSTYNNSGNQGGYGGGYGGSSSAQQGYELSNINAGDAGDFFTEVNEIDSDMEIMKKKTQNIRSVHQRSLQDIDTQAIEGTQEELRQLTEDASASNRALSMKIRVLKGKVHGDPGKQAQADRVEKNYKDALIEYQKVIVEFQERVRTQIRRQVKIVNPDATEQELDAACEDGQGQIFSQAIMTGNRRGEARSALSAVQARHKEIQRIEQTVQELAQLFQNMEALTIEQDPMIQEIDQRGQQVQEDVDKAHENLKTAVVSARSARRKKWWCLLICLIIIAIVVVIAVVVTQVNKSK